MEWPGRLPIAAALHPEYIVSAENWANFEGNEEFNGYVRTWTNGEDE